MTTSDWTITFVGTGSLFSPQNRALPATLLETASGSYLFDCGDGTVSRLRELGRTGIDVVAITDIGSSELGGILTLGEMNRRSKRKPLLVVGPAGLKAALEGFAAVSSFSAIELFDIVEAKPDTVLHQHDSAHLEAVPVLVPTGQVGYAYLLYEAPLPGRVNAEKARRLGIQGSDFARLLAGEPVRGVRPADVIGPPRPGRRVVIAGRGRVTEELRVALHNSEVAVFGTPFTDDRLEVAEDSGYLTGWEAATLANEENVRLCAIQRLGPYSRARYQLDEARQFNNNLVAPEDGNSIRVPLPERGMPKFHRSQNPRPDHPRTDRGHTTNRALGAGRRPTRNR